MSLESFGRKKLRIKNKYVREFFAEFLGIFILMVRMLFVFSFKYFLKENLSTYYQQMRPKEYSNTYSLNIHVGEYFYSAFNSVVFALWHQLMAD